MCACVNIGEESYKRLEIQFKILASLNLNFHCAIYKGNFNL